MTAEGKDSSRNARYPIDSVIKAASVLNSLSEADRELGVTELSEELGFSRSTTHRLLDTLVEISYAQRNPSTRRYSLGFGLFRIGLGLYEQYALQPDIEVRLRELVQETGETAKLGILLGTKMIYLSVVESSKSLRFVGRAGEWAPPHCTAMGKVLLAHLPQEEREGTLQRLVLSRPTSNSIDNLGKLRMELQRVSESGYAVDNEEFVVGSRGIAVPIHDGEAKVKASLSTAAPSARFSMEGLIALLPALKRTAKQLEDVIVI